jgi:hypothetical protein
VGGHPGQGGDGGIGHEEHAGVVVRFGRLWGVWLGSLGPGEVAG